MASEYLQDLAFRQLSHAIMATANSITNGAPPGNAPPNTNSGAAATATPPPPVAEQSSIFDVVRRKLSKVQDVIQGIAAPLKRRSMFEELPQAWPPSEHIEMSPMMHRGYSLGHAFVPCHLSNPTWCDHCGDFIWGLYKQCLRCQTCQYTCHQHCIPQVTLNCTSISEDGIELSASVLARPSHRPGLEPSLSLDHGLGRTSASVSQSGHSPGNISNVHGSSPGLPGSSGDGVVGVPQGVQKVQNERARVTRSASEGHVVIPQHKGSPVIPGRAVRPGCAVAVAPSPVVISPLHQQQQHTSHLSQSNPNILPPQADQQSSPLPPRPPPPQAVSSPSATAAAPEKDASPPQPAQCISPPVANSTAVPPSQRDTATPGSRTVPVGENLTGTASQAQPDSGRQPDTDLHTDMATEKDETDSGYRSGTIPDEKLPKVPSQATLDRQELKRKVAKFNHFVPAACLEVMGKESFQGFLKVTMNLIRPITMELGARPPSIYELLTREHIIEENTQQVAFYMPRDTHKSLHIDSETTTKEVVSSLLKKFHILDHPRKFAMYEQEFNDKNKLVRLRRLTDKDYPLLTLITWDPERMRNYRMVLQENETGEIVWDAFSLPELNNFLKVLDREERETILELRHKYAYMRQIMEKRMAEFRNQRRLSSKSKA